jgi:hypothetical protein
MTGPALIVLGGLVPLGAVAGVVLLGLLVVLWAVFALPSGDRTPSGAALPPITGAPAPVVTVETPDAAGAVEATTEPPPSATEASDEPAPAASPRPGPRRTAAAPTPEPTVTPAAAPVPAPVPAPTPEPTDPTRRDDLRNPFED